MKSTNGITSFWLFILIWMGGFFAFIILAVLLDFFF